MKLIKKGGISKKIKEKNTEAILNRKHNLHIFRMSLGRAQSAFIYCEEEIPTLHEYL